MRLIDADKLIEKLKGHSRGLNCEFNSACRIIIEVVKEQPTAFDVDEVLKQLQSYKDDIRQWNDTYTSGQISAYDRAITIVKVGGRND